MAVLLLNTTYEPLRVISIKRAVVLILDGRATVEEEDDGEYVRSESFQMPRPKVVRLSYFVKIPFRAKVPLNRRTLMARDNGVCQYDDCTRVGNTIDHVRPRSRGGKHAWDNVVACCSRHNQEKGDRLLNRHGGKDLDWSLKREPVAPMGTKWFVIGIAPSKLEDQWATYLDYNLTA